MQGPRLMALTWTEKLTPRGTRMLLEAGREAPQLAWLCLSCKHHGCDTASLSCSDTGCGWDSLDRLPQYLSYL